MNAPESLSPANVAPQAGEERYHSMLEGVDAGIVVHASDLRITAFNTKALEILGVTAAQMLNRVPTDPLWDRFRPDGSAMTPDERPAHRALATKRPVRDVVMGFNRPVSGGVTWVLVSANPVLTPRGRSPR